MAIKTFACAILTAFPLVWGALPSQAGVMRGDCSFFQTDSIDETGAQDYADCDIDLNRERLLVRVTRKNQEFTIPLGDVRAIEVASYDTPGQGRERTVFAFTYAADNPDGFEVMSFRVKRKRAITIMAVLREIAQAKIHGSVN